MIEWRRVRLGDVAQELVNGDAQHCWTGALFHFDLQANSFSVDYSV